VLLVRIAILSDIHGNRTAFEAVLRDLKETSPDLILHGGDLADSGSSPCEVIDQIRALGWHGVLGNTDEIHTRPESLDEFAASSKAGATLWTAVREMATWTDEKLGKNRVEWLRSLPRLLRRDHLALVHATAATLWNSPSPESADAEFQSAYEALDRPIIIFGHIHRPFVRRVPHPWLNEMIIVNSGSVGLSYDGDPRASYVLIDETAPAIRRVYYDVETEIRAVLDSGIPHSDWIVRTLRASSPQMD
jgi:predicted phosphodiesterase